MPEAFHAAMDAVLSGAPDALDPWLRAGPNGRAGLAVYRNTIAKARADALAALYPTVERLVGADWFREAALVFDREQPSSSPIMDDHGAGFADWLDRFSPAAGMSYLAPVARIDRAWSQSHRAADAPTLAASAVAALDPVRLFGAVARPHPATKLFWFDWSAPSIWIANRPDADGDALAVWDQVAEGLLLTRPHGAVRHATVDRTEWAFIDACRRGRPLGRIAAELTLAHPGLDLSALFARLLGLGVFTDLEMEGLAR